MASLRYNGNAVKICFVIESKTKKQASEVSGLEFGQDGGL
jgi:hypothetical protein